MSCPQCGEAARFVQYRDKDLISLMGEIRIARGYYHAVIAVADSFRGTKPCGFRRNDLPQAPKRPCV